MPRTRNQRRNNPRTPSSPTSPEQLTENNRQSNPLEQIQIQASRSQQSFNRNRIPKFSGDEKDIKIESWLKLHDIFARQIESEEDKVCFLATNLDGKAFQYFCDEIAEFAEFITYDEAKNKLVEHFGLSTLDPMTESLSRRLQKQEDVESYFKDKLFLLKKGKCPSASVIALLTNGMPRSYQTFLDMASINTPNEWLLKAKKLERRFQLENHGKSKSGVHVATTKDLGNPKENSKSNFNKGKGKPPKPCAFCKFLGETNYHWQSECPNPPRKNGTINVQTTNMAYQNIDLTKTRHTHMIDKHEMLMNIPVEQTSILLVQEYQKYINFTVEINQQPVRAIMDTGATIEIISERIAKKLNLPIDDKRKCIIRMVDGETSSLGLVTIKLTVGGVQRITTAQVVRGFPYAMLMSLNAPFRLQLDTGMKTAKLIHENKLIELKAGIQQHVYLNNSDEPTPTEIHQPKQSVFLLKYQNLIEEFKECFSDSEKDIGKITIDSHRIRLKENYQIINKKPYRRSITDNHEIEAQIKELLTKGFIRESKSPWASPVTLAPKKDGGKRLCIDYRDLNKQTLFERHPLPVIQDVIDRLHGSMIYSVLDVRWGYWHVQMHEKDIEKTAFVTASGHYEWTVMPFGLACAPFTFQRILQKTLGSYHNNGAINYLDDIILYSPNEAEHITLLRNVLKLLINANIKLKRSKCQFGLTEVEYLGHIISQNSVKPSPFKIKAVKDFPEPRNTKQTQQFLGLCNYFRKYIKNYTEIAYPLMKLLKKDVKFDYLNEEQLKSFNELKSQLTSEPVLKIFNPNDPIELHTDASGIGIGAVLIQLGHPIAYFSRRLNEHQEKYSASELECLAMVEAIEHFEVYLSGVHFTVVSDHSALVSIFENKHLYKLYFRWYLRISTYSFTVIHRPGTQLQHADALSRNINFVEFLHLNNLDKMVMLGLNTPSLLSEDELRKHQAEDDFQKFKITTKNGMMYMKKKGIMKIVVPKQLISKILGNAHDNYGHPGIQKTFEIISSYYWWPNMFENIKDYAKSCHSCQLVKTVRRPSLGHLHPFGPVHEPYELMGLDTIVMGKIANNTKAKYLQVLIDHHSRFVWAIPTATNTSDTIINVLTKIFSKFPEGKPTRLLTDNGTNFTSKKFKNFLKNKKIKRSLATPYHPQTNGMVEKVNHVLVERLRIACKEKPTYKWSTLVPYIITQYNMTPHSSTGFPPDYLLFGQSTHNIQIPVNEARKKAVEKVEQLKKSYKQKYDDKHLDFHFKIGDLVKKRIPSNHPSNHKLSAAFDGPFTVVSVESDLVYRIAKENEQPIQAHTSQLEPYYLRSNGSPE